ncbi:phospholipase domain-containing protein, partial [Achromobacter xylosoxidans]|jgi:phospholipase C
VLRFLEARFGVAEPNISPFRRAVCGDLTSAFNFKTPNTEALPTLAGRATRAAADQLRTAQEALPQMPLPTDMQLPLQASGTRPSRALPYELHTSARCAAAGTVELLFANGGTQGAVFHVYDRYHLDRLPRRYMVEAGKTLSDTWNALQDNLGMYDLWVLGPNGYHRHFKGDTNRIADSGSLPEIRVCYDIANGEVYAEFLNTGAQACTFTVTPQAYRQDAPVALEVAGGGKASRHWTLAASGQWYDFAVTCSSDPAFYRRFAGRVETGAHTVSDPAMGLSGA